MTADRLPYPGLRAYERDESDLFFGREGCVDEMVDRLAASHFLAVLGASGSGKSSLVRTGLLDALEIGLLAPAGPLWVVADCHPGGSPIRNLAASLLRATHDTVPDTVAIDALETFLRRGPRAIVEWVGDGNLPAGHNLLLLIDQFEELFRYGDYAGREEAEAFAALLLESARSGGPLHVVITMRSEYLGACALIPGLAEQINTSLYLTRRMTREECREAIEGPASVMGFDIEPALVAQILNDLAALAPWERDRENSQLQRLSRQADQLPLMQHALSRLWQLAGRRAERPAEIRRADGRADMGRAEQAEAGHPETGRAGRRAGIDRPILTLRDYLDIGQLRGTLDQHAEEVIGGLGPEARPLVRLVFRALVSGSDLSDAVRKPMRLDDLRYVVGGDSPLVNEVINAFRARDCNFLRPPDNYQLTGDTIIDISHESLIRQWSSLAQWFGEEARSDGLWARLIYGAERHAGGEGELLSGLDLANALAWWDREQPTEGWARNHGGKFQEIRRYLRESREAEEKHAQEQRERARREQQRLRRTIAVVSGVALVCFLLAGFAFYSNSRLLEAEKTAREANKSLLSAASYFVHFASLLKSVPGISNEDIRTDLKNGAEVLDKLSSQPENRREVTLVQTQFASIAAETLLDSGQAEDALKLTSGIEEKFRTFGDIGSLTSDEVLQIFAVRLTAGRAATDLGRTDDAADIAGKILTFADEQKAVTGDRLLLERAKAEQMLASTFTNKGNYKDAREHAERCIADLDQDATRNDADKLYYLGRCHTALGVTLWQQKLVDESKAQVRAAEDYFERIPAGSKTVPMLISEATAISNIGFLHAKAGDDVEALEYYRKAEAPISLSRIDLQQNVHLRAKLIEVRRDVAQLYVRRKDTPHAVEWYDKIMEVAFLDEKWRGNRDLSDNLEYALEGYRDFLWSIEWQNDKQLIRRFEEVYRYHIEVHGFRMRHKLDRDCGHCELMEMENQYYALTKFDRFLHEDRFAEAIALADATIAEAKSVLASQKDSRDAIVARRAWFWTVYQLPASVEDIPSVTSVPEQIERLGASRQRTKDLLQAYPGAWYIERKLGQIDSGLAKLDLTLGHKDDAVAAAEEGAKLYDRGSIETLADWYKTGSGPIPRDTEKAKQYEATLASRNWTVGSLTTHNARFLWEDGGELHQYSYQYEDPRTKDDNSVARIIWQLETLEGVRLSDNARQQLEGAYKTAIENHQSFVDAVVMSFSVGDSTDALVRQLRKFIDEDNINGAANALSQRWEASGGAEAIAGAIKDLIEGAPDRDFVRSFAQIAQQNYSWNDYALAEAILNAIIPRASKDAAAAASMYSVRGNARQSQKNLSGAEADYATSLALNPNNAEVLNSLGYLWVNQDHDLPAAIELLTRASELNPQSAFIRDSLGWAEVKAGDTEGGLKLLQSAADDRPDLAEILAHLADAHRRLGQTAEAIPILARAASIATDADVISFIRGQRALLGEDPAVRPNTDEAIAAAARMLVKTDPKGRIGISTDGAGIAIRGYDPVSYFTKGDPELGSVDFAAVWHDALWLFATSDHRDMFLAQPEKYAPAYGGFCAYCAAVGNKVHGNPIDWAIHGDRLYLESSILLRRAWNENPDKHIADADAAWPALEKKKTEPTNNTELAEQILPVAKTLQ